MMTCAQNQDHGFSRLVDSACGVWREPLPARTAVLHAYFDESGKWGDRDAIFFGGFICQAPDWELFAQEWWALLDELDFPYLHTSELVALKGVYAKHRNKIKPENVPAILERFAQIVPKYVNYGYGVGVDTKHFRSMSQAFRSKVKDPHYAAFKMTMNMVMEEVSVARQMQPAINWRAGIICDQDAGTADHCLKWFTKFRTHNAGARDALNGICFCDSAGIPPIQAADLLAYVLRMEVERRKMKNPPRPTMLSQILMTRRHPDTRKLIPFFRGNILDAKTLDEMASGQHTELLQSLGI